MSDFWKCISCGLANNEARISCQACFTPTNTSKTQHSSTIIKHSIIQPKMGTVNVPKNELLAYGFIKQHIENRLKRHTLFPLTLMQMICNFYSVPLNLLLFIANTETKYRSISNLIHKYSRRNICFNSLCYVPNISSHINMTNSNTYKHKSYDGLIGVCKLANNFVTDYNTYYPCVALVESNKMTDKMICYNLYLSSKSTGQNAYYSAQNIVYCKEKRMVIYYDRLKRRECSIQCLKLKDIDLCCTDFEFKMWKTLSGKRKFVKAMECIYNENKLFLIAGKSKNGRSMHCNLFDYGMMKWKTCVKLTFEELRYTNNDFAASIAKNNIYNAHNVHVVSNNGQISIYDMNKDKWNVLYPFMDRIVMTFDGNSTVWFDDNPQVLYCCNNSTFSPKLSQFDVRDKQWIENDDYQLMFNHAENAYLNLYLR